MAFDGVNTNRPVQRPAVVFVDKTQTQQSGGTTGRTPTGSQGATREGVTAIVGGRRVTLGPTDSAAPTTFVPAPNAPAPAPATGANAVPEVPLTPEEERKAIKAKLNEQFYVEYGEAGYLGIQIGVDLLTSKIAPMPDAPVPSGENREDRNSFAAVSAKLWGGFNFHESFRSDAVKESGFASGILSLFDDADIFAHGFGVEARPVTFPDGDPIVDVVGSFGFASGLGELPSFDIFGSDEPPAPPTPQAGQAAAPVVTKSEPWKYGVSVESSYNLDDRDRGLFHEPAGRSIQWMAFVGTERMGIYGRYFTNKAPQNEQTQAITFDKALTYEAGITFGMDAWRSTPAAVTPPGTAPVPPKPDEDFSMLELLTGANRVKVYARQTNYSKLSDPLDDSYANTNDVEGKATNFGVAVEYTMDLNTNKTTKKKKNFFSDTTWGFDARWTNAKFDQNDSGGIPLSDDGGSFFMPSAYVRIPLVQKRGFTIDLGVAYSKNFAAEIDNGTQKIVTTNQISPFFELGLLYNVASVKAAQV